MDEKWLQEMRAAYRWTDKRRAAFVRYRNECLERERHETTVKVFMGAAFFLVGLALGLML